MIGQMADLHVDDRRQMGTLGEKLPAIPGAKRNHRTVFRHIAAKPEGAKLDEGVVEPLVLVHSVETLIQIQLLCRLADGHLAAHLDELRRVDAVHLGEGFHVAQAGLPPIRGNLGFILQSLDHQTRITSSLQPGHDDRLGVFAHTVNRRHRNTIGLKDLHDLIFVLKRERDVIPCPGSLEQQAASERRPFRHRRAIPAASGAGDGFPSRARPYSSTPNR